MLIVISTLSFRLYPYWYLSIFKIGGDLDEAWALLVAQVNYSKLARAARAGERVGAFLATQNTDDP